MHSEITVAAESSLTPDAQALLKGMYDELNVIFAAYGGEEGDGTMPPLEFNKEDGIFVIARIDGAAVGCAGIRRFDADTCEVKRVFVSESARRRGVARAIMQALEQQAVALGYRKMVLETTILQPAALRVYESLGYSQIDNYGKYKDDPITRCYGKALQTANAQED